MLVQKAQHRLWIKQELIATKNFTFILYLKAIILPQGFEKQ